VEYDWPASAPEPRALAEAKFASQYCQMFEQARDSNNDFFMVHLSIPTPAEEIDTQQCH
jgi:hypothetical protein